MARSSHDVRVSAAPRPDARTVLRLNAIASLTAGSIMLVFAGPLARRSGVGQPAALAVCAAFLLGYGLDELSVAVGRRLRRWDVVLYALADVALMGAAIAFVIAGPEALNTLERSLVSLSAAVLGWFAVEGFRAARAL